MPHELAELLNCNLDSQELELCLKLIESGRVDSTALAMLVAELQRALPVTRHS